MPVTFDTVPAVEIGSHVSLPVRRYVSPIAPCFDCPPIDGRALRDQAVEAQLRAAREIPASKLSVAEKNLVWRHVKANDAAQLAFLNDPIVQRLIRERGAVPVFPPDLVRAALATSKATTP